MVDNPSRLPATRGNQGVATNLGPIDARTEEQQAIELNARALAERERAMIETQFQLALRKPRDLMAIESKLVEYCKNPSFADAAVWERSVGREKNDEGQWVDTIGTGLSIRFAETAAQLYGALYVSSDITLESDSTRVMRSIVMDVENNLVWIMPDAIPKLMDRVDLRKGDVPISSRTNSKNQTVHTIRADEGAVRNKMNGALSRTQRNNILRLIPGWIKERCWETLQETLREELGDPARREKLLNKLIEAFGTFGFSQSDIAELAGKAIASFTKEDIENLRGVKNLLVEGQTTRAELLVHVRGKKGESAKPAETENAGGTAETNRTKSETNPTGSETKRAEPDANRTDSDPKQESAPEGKKEPAGLSLDSFNPAQLKAIELICQKKGVARNRATLDDWLSRWTSGKDNLLTWLKDASAELKLGINFEAWDK